MDTIIFGNGFIVDHLAKSLLADGNKVTVFSEKKPKIIGANVYNPAAGEAAWYNKLNFIGGYVGDYNDVYYAINRGEYVINLDQLDTNLKHLSVERNVTGAGFIAQSCLENNAARLIYLSSSDVYELNIQSPISEDSPTIPNSFFGKTKLYGENITLEYKNNFPIVILRTTFLTGAGKTNGINQIISWLMNGDRPIISGDGEYKIDIVHVDDVVQAIKLAMIKSSGGIYNVGSGTSRTLNEFLKWSKILLEKTSIEPQYTIPQTKLPDNFQLDISKIQKELGYKPKFDLEKAIELTIKEWVQWI